MFFISMNTGRAGARPSPPDHPQRNGDTVPLCEDSRQAQDALPNICYTFRMTNQKACLCFALPALLCGAFLGYLAQPAAPETETEDASPAAARPSRKSSDDAALNRMRERIKELERQLADAKAMSANAEEDVPVKAEERPQNPFLRNGPPRMPTAAEMRANMEELREKDPARYAQMTNRFARWQEHRLQRTSERLDILASVDTSRLSEKERETHEALQDAIVKREELRELLNPQDETVTEEQRRKTFDELRKLEQTMRQLETSERNTLLSKTARSFGLSKANAKEMTDAIKAIYQATGGEGPRHGFGGPPNGGRRGR